MTRIFVWVLLACGILLLANPSLQASCLGASSQQVTFEVQSCEFVDVDKLHPPPNWNNLSSYHGAVVEVNILSVEKEGPRKPKYMPAPPVAPGKMRVFLAEREKKACLELKPGNKWSGTLSWACCDGDPNVPCLLGFSEYVFDLKEIGNQKP